MSNVVSCTYIASVGVLVGSIEQTSVELVFSRCSKGIIKGQINNLKNPDEMRQLYLLRQCGAEVGPFITWGLSFKGIVVSFPLQWQFAAPSILQAV